MGSHYVIQVGLELVNLQRQLSNSCDYQCVSHPTQWTDQCLSFSSFAWMTSVLSAQALRYFILWAIRVGTFFSFFGFTLKAPSFRLAWGLTLIISQDPQAAVSTSSFEDILGVMFTQG